MTLDPVLEHNTYVCSGSYVTARTSIAGRVVEVPWGTFSTVGSSEPVIAGAFPGELIAHVRGHALTLAFAH